MHLSNFRPVKRVTDVVEIFALVREKMPAKLVLIGDGPDRGAAEYLARKKKLRKTLFFLGKQDQVYEKLAAGRSFPAAFAAGILRTCRAGSHGLRSPGHRHQRRRPLGSCGARRRRLPGGTRRREVRGAYAIEILSRADRGREWAAPRASTPSKNSAPTTSSPNTSATISASWNPPQPPKPESNPVSARSRMCFSTRM